MGSLLVSRQLQQSEAFLVIMLPVLTITGDVKNEVALKRLPSLDAKKAIINYLEQREDKVSWTGIENGPFFDGCAYIFSCSLIKSTVLTWSL